MNDLISIIIPVYNTEMHLPLCIESILAQTYKNFELLLINDGSTDNSGKLCDELACRDERIRVIHKENGGVSSARNVGIEQSNGKYITFIDSDDSVTKDYLEILSNAAQGGTYDFVHGRYDMQGEEVPVRAEYHYDQELKENLSSLLWFLGPVPNLYKKEVILQNQLCFPKGITYAEDTIFTYEYLACCNKICVIPDCIYYYNTGNETSALHKLHENTAFFMEKRNEAFKTFLDVLNIEKELKQFILDYFRYYSFSYIMEHFYYRGSKKQLKKVFYDYYGDYKDSLLNVRNSIKTKNPQIIEVIHPDYVGIAYRFSSVSSYTGLCINIIFKRLALLFRLSPAKITKKVFNKLKKKLFVK